MMSRLELHGAWRRSIGGREIDFVSVPGCYPPVGECELSYEFSLPHAFRQEGSRYFLCTEGVLARAEFSLNGQPVGTAGPYVPYRFELPAESLQARNVVTARVWDIGERFGNTPGRRADAGLFREVYLERRPPAFLDSFACRSILSDDLSLAGSEVIIEADGQTRDEAKVSLIDCATGLEAFSASGDPHEPIRFELPWPKLWSPEAPNLYRLVIRLGEETVEEKIGFRRLETRGSDFYLNNQRLLLKGVCRHEFDGTYGYRVPPEEVRRDLARIKLAGFNYVRLVHAPQAACVSRLAAEIGLLVSEEPGACFQDLSDEAISGASLESLRRTVRRDRNVPSVFAWLIYNECHPNNDYAARAGEICRTLDPGRFVSFADCTGWHDQVKAMLEAGGLSYYGINLYDFSPGTYVERMKVYHERPLVFTEWGGWIGQGNPRELQLLCDTFVHHTREDTDPRLAGCSFWVWQDYEEYSRPGPAAVDGWTIEGLTGKQKEPKPDLQTLSDMCFAMDRPEVVAPPQWEILCPAPRRAEPWRGISLADIAGDQSHLEAEIEAMRRRFAARPPAAGPLTVAGIDFLCAARPLLLGPGREEIIILVDEVVRGLAVLGHVALKGGYPSSAIESVFHKDAERPTQFGTPASRYEFVFDDDEIVQPLLHGVHVLRSNNICRWWKTAPRAPETQPAVQATLHPSFEVLRFDLWQHDFGVPRRLREIRWRLEDAESIQAMLALSVALTDT